MLRTDCSGEARLALHIPSACYAYHVQSEVLGTAVAAPTSKRLLVGSQETFHRLLGSKQLSMLLGGQS